MASSHPFVGSPTNRIDGPAKVTGAAKYAGEFSAGDLAHGIVISSTIAKGRVVRIDTAAAMSVPGVIDVFTHQNRPRAASFDASKYRDQVAPPGHPFRPLADDRILFGGQPIALVVGETFDIARHAASLIRAEYAAEPAVIDVRARRAAAYEPPEKRLGPVPEPRGNAGAALATAALHAGGEYRVAVEHHNPMEPNATTVVWRGGGKITVHDKTQGVQNTHGYVTRVFGLSADDVEVVSPYVGGAFGSSLRPQYQLFLAVMASLHLQRSVRVVLTRDQMFTLGYRPDTIQTVALGAEQDGRLTTIMHDAVAGTSVFEDYQETVVDWSGLLYRCDNVALSYRVTQIDTYTPSDMRAPGATLGVFALESAMDELAVAGGIDPVELRLRNYADRDQIADKPFTSKALRECYREGAERFGWSRRSAPPRSMRDGRELIGMGMATGVWEALMVETCARATLTPDGRLVVATAASDIGTGTATILAQIAADALGLPMDRVTVKIADSTLPACPVEGGSWTAASAGAAVAAAGAAVAKTLFKHARQRDGSPLANTSRDHVVFADGGVARKDDPAQRVSIADAMAAAGVDRIEAEESASRGKLAEDGYSCYTHSAVFAEVSVDEQLGVVRVVRVVNAVAGGRIINPKTARSQILGGVVMGIGMALHEETLPDHNLARFMTHNFADYHIPANADVRDIDVIFVVEHDDKVSPLGVKGLGEIGLVGVAAAIGNAVHHATGKRIRELPITLDKLL